MKILEHMDFGGGNHVLRVQRWIVWPFYRREEEWFLDYSEGIQSRGCHDYYYEKEHSAWYRKSTGKRAPCRLCRRLDTHLNLQLKIEKVQGLQVSYYDRMVGPFS